jgi:hypothetical protein
MLVVGVAQRTEAFGNLSGFPLNQHTPPPFVAVVYRKADDTGTSLGRELAAAGSVRTTP